MIFTRNGLRFDALAPHTIDGEQFPPGAFMHEDVRARFNVVVTDLPPQPADYSVDTYTVEKIDPAPYVIYTRKSDEQIAQVLMEKAKVERTATVEQITVTTASGKTFDGDEISQGRMARAIIALDPLQTTLWILADNTPDPAVTREELREALRLAGSAQTAVWIAPYQP